LEYGLETQPPLRDLGFCFDFGFGFGFGFGFRFGFYDLELYWT
jgi:hypothetical protein